MPIRAWLASSLTQHFPGTPPRLPRPMTIHAALNERFAFQVGVRAEGAHENSTVVADAPRGWAVRVRRIGYVPLRHRNGIPNPEGDGHLPGLFPDPLFDESQYLVTVNETHAFLVTVQPGRGATPGRNTIALRVIGEHGIPIVLRVTVILHPIHIRPRRNFHVTNWFTADSVMNRYGCQGYDERFWAIVPAYFRNMADHGQNMVSSPLLNWTVVDRPTQLLIVRRENGRFRFDFSVVKRWTDLARANGITHFEWMDLLTCWNAAFAARVYEGDIEKRRLLWRTKPDATTPHYKKYAAQIGTVDCPDAASVESRSFFSQMLPALHEFLKVEKLVDKSLFHIGDEPEKENIHNYRQSRAMLREFAPWLKVMEPFCWMDYAEPGLMDVRAPRTSLVPQILERGLSTWAYYCGNPGNTHINRLMDTPLAQVRMNGWLFYRFPIGGFLHWGYNFWNRLDGGRFVTGDPFANFDTFTWPHHAYGDCWSVYPGPTGPLDTLRWEAFADSLQDYALLQTLDVPRDDHPLRKLEAFDRFPIAETWINRARLHYLNRKVYGPDTQSS